jgi:DNA mismatch repair protein MutS
VHVAALAGLPRPVVARARELLRALEARALTLEARPGALAALDGGAGAGTTPQVALEAGLQAVLLAGPEPLLEELAALEPDGLSPLEALQQLYELRAAARRRLGQER